MYLLRLPLKGVPQENKGMKTRERKKGTCGLIVIETYVENRFMKREHRRSMLFRNLEFLI